MQHALQLPVIVSENQSICTAFFYRVLVELDEPANMKSKLVKPLSFSPSVSVSVSLSIPLHILVGKKSVHYLL